jgi:L-fuculose-phosphate aldolase
MDILSAKQAVIDAGRKLSETGLIARTWGNVSARVDAETFVITPSGKGYDALTPADIAVLHIKDLSVAPDETGQPNTVKPSSEKGIHAAVYAQRPETGFVIHTHQFLASIAGLSKEGAICGAADFWADIVGPEVPIAKYGLPGTGKLKKAVAACVKANPASKAFLMAHHGALCVGADSAQAFQVAQTLEQVCERYITKRFLEKTGEIATGIDEILHRIKSPAEDSAAPDFAPYNSVRSAKAFVMMPADGDGSGVDVRVEDGKILNACPVTPDTLQIHRAIYQKDKKVNAIRHVKSGALLVASEESGKMAAFLDDFAQIAGAKIKNVRLNGDADAVCKALKGKNAVLLRGNGALTTGVNDDEAGAVEIVAQKNAAAALAAKVLGQVKPIGAVDGALMRFVYVKKYAKKK